MMRVFDNRKYLADPLNTEEPIKRTPKVIKAKPQVKHYAIYAVICNRTNYVYVGQSQSVEKRLKSHKTELAGNRNKAGKYLMQKHYNLYKDSFEYRIVSNVESKEKLLEAETAAIEHFKAEGYNMYNLLHTTVGATIVNVNQAYAPVLKLIAAKLDRGELNINDLSRLLL